MKDELRCVWITFAFLFLIMKYLDYWKDIPCYEGIYRINFNGEVISYDRLSKNRDGTYRKRSGMRLNIHSTKQGYRRCELFKNKKKKSFLIHRLLCLSFISNPDNKPQVNHINGIKNDNRISNLEWVTARENTKHAYDTLLKTKPKGELNGFSKLKKEYVLFIRNNFCEENIVFLSEKYKITTSHVRSINRKDCWKHI